MPVSSPPARPIPSARAAVIAVLAGLVLAVPLPASAHDELVSSTPADQATLAQTPTEVVLTFDEPAIALGTRIVVTGPTGEVQQGTPQIADKTVRQSLVPGSPGGTYTVDWRVTSQDGHPVSGVLTFTAAAAGPDASAGPVSAQPPPPGSPRAPVWLWPLVALALVGMITVAVRSRRRREHRERTDLTAAGRATSREEER